jgi:morphogenesis family protein
VTVQRTGNWAAARRLLAQLPERLGPVTRRAILQEAHALRRDVVQGLTLQQPGGSPIQPLSDLTLASRRLQRFAGTKALIRRGDLRRSIAVIDAGDQIFIGVSRSARSADGKSLIDVAHVHEYGSQPIVIPVTPAMRRFLAMVYRQAGRPRTPGSGRGVVVVQVPARPFLRPAFDRFKVGLERRLLGRITKALGLGSP